MKEPQPNSDSSISRIPRRNLEGWARALFEGIDDAIFVHDLNGRILDVNPAACRRMGYTREELLKLTTKDIDDPEFATGFGTRLEEQMAQGHLRIEGRHRTKDGTLVLVDINTSAIEFNSRPCVLAVMRDITEQKKAEAALVKQSQLLRSMLENMGDAVIVVDENEYLLLSNPAADRCFGLPAELSQKRKHWPPQLPLLQLDRVTPFAAERLPWTRAMQGRNRDGIELFVQTGPGAQGVYLSMTARPLRDETTQAKGAIIVCRDISEQKRAERRQTVQNSVARVLTSTSTLANLRPALLQTLAEAMSWEVAALWVVDADKKYLRCAEVWHRPDLPLQEYAHGSRFQIYARGEGIPGSVWERGEPLWLPNFATRTSHPLIDLTSRGINKVFAFPISAGGEITGVIEAFGQSMEAPDDDQLALAATLGSQVGQVLERQRVEQALRESQAFYHSLVESLPQYILRKDRQGRFTFGNHLFCSLVGKQLEQLVGQTDYDLFPEEQARKYRADDELVLGTGRSLDVIEEHILPDGSTIHVQIIKTPIHDESGTIIGTQGLFWDVTERRRAEQALAASERRYRQLTEATLDAIVVADQQGHITLFNPAAEKLFGCSASEAVGQLLDLLIPPEYLERHNQGLQRYVTTRISQIVGKTIELYGRRKDGSSFPLELALSAIEIGVPDANGQAPLQFLGAIRDLTERNRYRSAMIQNEKLASIGLLSAGVAHEINNPLAFIGNNLAVLQRDLVGVMKLLQLYEEQREPLRTVAADTVQQIQTLADDIDLPYIRDNLGRLLSRTREGVDRVTRIVHSLRGLARTERPQRQLARIPDLVETSLDIVRNRIKKQNVQIECTYPPDPTLWCVPTQLSQVFLNLLVNAVQAIAETERTDGRIQVSAERMRDNMVIKVADNGNGIPAETLPKIFDPFFTTKDVGEGTGLGLSISHNIVEGHGGSIDVESAPGAGTVFTLYLPLKPA